jgi:hypothetical protein
VSGSFFCIEGSESFISELVANKVWAGVSPRSTRVSPISSWALLPALVKTPSGAKVVIVVSLSNTARHAHPGRSHSEGRLLLNSNVVGQRIVLVSMVNG